MSIGLTDAYAATAEYLEDNIADLGITVQIRIDGGDYSETSWDAYVHLDMSHSLRNVRGSHSVAEGRLACECNCEPSDTDAHLKRRLMDAVKDALLGITLDVKGVATGAPGTTRGYIEFFEADAQSLGADAQLELGIVEFSWRER